MTANLRFTGHLKDFTGGRAEVTVEAGRSIRETLAGLGLNPLVVALAVVNGEAQSKDYVIADGDQVKVLAVIGGG